MGFRSYKGNTKSENGWPICDQAEIVKPLVPGTDNVRPEIRSGYAATILVAVAALFHQRVRRIDRYKPRDYWGFSWDNAVSNSNHLSGTGIDLIATELPWGLSASPRLTGAEIAACRTILADLGGCVYWGEDWGRKDPMHWQLNFAEGDQRLIDLADRLTKGYLGVYGPPDPDAFPLPKNYFYGPLDGPRESISGLFATDPQPWKDALKRWQGKVGIPQTGVWDPATAERCSALQKQCGWPVSGYLFEGEWNVIIKGGMTITGSAPVAPAPAPAPGPSTEVRGLRWADVSQYQSMVADDSYPHRILSARTNSGDKVDEKIARNMQWAKSALDSGKLDIFIPYYFFRPGQANCDLHRRMLEQAGLWNHPKVVTLVDVEDANQAIKGDQSAEVNDEIERLMGWYGNRKRVIGYWNPIHNRDLWLTKPAGLRLIVPSYGVAAGSPKLKPEGYFAHQFSDAEPCPPFGRCDGNFADMTMRELQDMLGIEASGAAGVSTWDAIYQAVAT